MKWYVVYKGKAPHGGLAEELRVANISFFVPTILTESLNAEGNRMEEKPIRVISNMVFIQTDKNIMTLIDQTEGLQCPMKDSLTGKPAVVPDDDMNRFMAICSKRTEDVLMLRDSYSKFAKNQKVRVKAGDFAGIEGRIVRILRDHKLVISLGQMAIAVSGIDRSLLEPID